MDIGPRPSAKPLSDTKCLDTIRRLKRIRRILRRTRLVSVAPEADTQEVHQEQSFEKDAPRQQHDTSPSTNIEDVIARGVEATMRRILSEKDFLLTKKCSPQKKKIEDKEIQREKAAELSCERDFLLVSRNMISSEISLTSSREKCGVCSRMFSTSLKMPIS
jgi:hypothetical protein